MRFDSRVFQLAKDVEHPEQNEDAWRVDGPRGIAVIADGVTSGIFSRLWAGILTDAIVADMPNPEDPESFARWLTLRREAWAAEIDVARLSWLQKPKLRAGAFSTLLWVRLLPDRENPQPDAWRLCGFAVGDSCLFHVRHGQVLRTFPLQQSAELEANPIVVGSMDRDRDQLLQFKRFDEPCLGDDLVVLCTDAVAGWALRSQESGQGPAWESYWSMTDDAWREEVLRLREQQQMRFDDTTLMLLRVTDKAAAETPPAGPATTAAAGSFPWNETLKSPSDRAAGRAGVTAAVQRFAAGLARRWPRAKP